jgi:O-antigen ligase
LARWQTAGFLAVLLLALAAVGLDGVGSFFGERLVDDASVRSLLRDATWDAATEFWPVGSGLGTFGAVFAHYQPATIAEFVPHAHSDYVQLLMELGVLALPLTAAALYVGMRRIRVLWTAVRNSTLDDEGRRLAACGLGLLALLLHAWVDFNLRIPANAMIGAFLAGAFCRRWSDGSEQTDGYR